MIIMPWYVKPLNSKKRYFVCTISVTLNKAGYFSETGKLKTGTCPCFFIWTFSICVFCLKCSGFHMWAWMMWLTGSLMCFWVSNILFAFEHYIFDLIMNAGKQSLLLWHLLSLSLPLLAVTVCICKWNRLARHVDSNCGPLDWWERLLSVWSVKVMPWQSQIAVEAMV